MPGKLPVILLGDFNTTPGSKTYKLLSNKSLNFESAYMRLGKEPSFTTFKIRERVEKKTVDYIFTRGFSIIRLLSMPTVETIGKSGLPSQNYPSDHLSLVCQVTFKLDENL